MTVTLGELHEVLKLFESSDFKELVLETEGLRVHVSRNGAGGSPPEHSPGGYARGADPTTKDVPPAPLAPSRGPGPAEAPPDGAEAVHASVSGTFYRSPSPGAEAFVEVGARVTVGDSIGLIEVMKLFTSVVAEQAGEVVGIVAENAAPVETGDVLMYVRPDA